LPFTIWHLNGPRGPNAFVGFRAISAWLVSNVRDTSNHLVTEHVGPTIGFVLRVHVAQRELSATW
jgi:hypothetical protein